MEKEERIENPGEKADQSDNQRQVNIEESAKWLRSLSKKGLESGEETPAERIANAREFAKKAGMTIDQVAEEAGIKLNYRKPTVTEVENPRIVQSFDQLYESNGNRVRLWNVALKETVFANKLEGKKLVPASGEYFDANIFARRRGVVEIDIADPDRMDPNKPHRHKWVRTLSITKDNFEAYDDRGTIINIKFELNPY